MNLTKALIFLLALQGVTSAQPLLKNKMLINNISIQGGIGGIAIWEDGKRQSILENSKEQWFLDPTWSPNGGIFFATRDHYNQGGGGLGWMDATGHNLKVLKEFPQNIVVLRPTSSPDGKHLAFYIYDNGYQMWLANGDGSNPHPIGPIGAAFPTWSSNSREILASVQTSEPSGCSLVVYDLEGKPLRTLYRSHGGLWDLAWSPDEQRIVFAKLNPESTNTHLYSVDKLGQNLEALSEADHDDESESSPQFDPQGNLYFTRVGHGKIGIYRLEPETRQAVELVDDAAMQVGLTLVRLQMTRRIQLTP